MIKKLHLCFKTKVNHFIGLNAKLFEKGLFGFGVAFQNRIQHICADSLAFPEKEMVIFGIIFN